MEGLAVFAHQVVHHAAVATIPPPITACLSLLRSLWLEYHNFSNTLVAAESIASNFTSLWKLIQSIVARQDLLEHVQSPIDKLVSLLGLANAIAQEAKAAIQARHGSWRGLAISIMSLAVDDRAPLERKLADLNTQLTQTIGDLNAAIGVHLYDVMSSGVSVVTHALAAGATQLDQLKSMVEKLLHAQEHSEANPAARRELEWLQGAALAGASDPYSSMVSNALKCSRDLFAEVEDAALAKFQSRGHGADANSLVLNAPILMMSDLAEWSPKGAKLVGAGSYGEVRPGKLKEFGLPVAVKTLPHAVVIEACKSEQALEHLLRAVRRETDIQFTLRDHSGVATVYGMLLDIKELTIGLVMELAECSLQRVLMDREGSPDLPLPCRVAVLEQVASALAVMHRRTPPMLHGDVKSANVLIKRGVPLGANGSAMLTDFGMAQVEANLTESTGYLKASVLCGGSMGTPLWKAPELFGRRREQPSEASDTYAFGMLMFEVLTRRLPFEGTSIRDESSLVDCIREGGRPDTEPGSAFQEHVIKAALPQRGPLLPLMQRCWDGDKSKRPSMSEVALLLRQELADLGGAVAIMPSSEQYSESGGAGEMPSSGGSTKPAISGSSFGLIAIGKVVAVPSSSESIIPLFSGNSSGLSSGGAETLPTSVGIASSTISSPLVPRVSTGKTEFTEHGMCIASASGDGTLRVWDAATYEYISLYAESAVAGHAAVVYSVCALGNGRLVSGHRDNMLRVWDAATGERIRLLEGHTGLVTSVCSLGDGCIVSGSADATLRVWDAAMGMLYELNGHSKGVTSVCLLENGCIASGSSDNTLRLWDLAKKACVRVFEGHTEMVTCVCSLGDGRIVSGSDDSTLRVWELFSGSCTQVLVGHVGWVTCVCALGNGRFVSGSVDTKLRVWDAAMQKCLQVLDGHENWVRCVCTLDGGSIISGSNDTTVRVWDIATGTCVKKLEGHKGIVHGVSSLACSPDMRVRAARSPGCICS